MIVSKISLKNYRNYDELNLKFCEGTNIIIGDNGQGKTNILESLYFLSLTKSYRTSDDYILIKNNKNNCKVSARVVEKKIPKKITISLNNSEKVISLNNNVIKKVSDFIGTFNIVMVSPEDIEIIKSSPLIRRNLLNIELSKLSRNYINVYNEYNKLLKMRNDYLKLLLTSNIADDRYFDVITDKLIDRAIYIYQERKKFIDDVNKHLSLIYKNISGIEGLSILYIPNIEIEDFNIESLEKKLKDQYTKYKNKEINLGMTIYGPHRDDFKIMIGNEDIKSFGSQGQQKIAVISLKISILKTFYERKQEMPVLLLDDIFSELDKKRKNKLINYINESGQVIITANDIRDINKKKLKDIKIFEIKDKNIIEKR